MLSVLRHQWQKTRTSFWFVPAMMVTASVALALALVWMEPLFGQDAKERWPLLFGAGAAGARGLLSAVATSMITVAGVVFSITIVALTLTSTQYTSRVMRNFIGDRANQAVLGVFLGVFAYCLVVLRTIRGGDEGAFVPSVAVTGGLVLAFVGLGFLIFFIHHIAVAIQASSIVAAAAHETMARVDQLFPEQLGADNEVVDGRTDEIVAHMAWTPVVSSKTGYVQSVHADGLLSFAREHGVVVRMERGVGEFVVDGSVLISVSRPLRSDAAVEAANELFVVDRYRTVEQDPAFGIRQIVDIALKALSPGINDPTTAVLCLDYLGAILVRLGARRFPPRYRRNDQADENDDLRVIARSPTFEGLLALAFDQIRHSAASDVAVLAHLRQVLGMIADRTEQGPRLAALQEQLAWVLDTAEHGVRAPRDRAIIKDAAVDAPWGM